MFELRSPRGRRRGLGGKLKRRTCIAVPRRVSVSSYNGRRAVQAGGGRVVEGGGVGLVGGSRGSTGGGQWRCLECGDRAAVWTDNAGQRECNVGRRRWQHVLSGEA
jgi:hypothetical protein